MPVLALGRAQAAAEEPSEAPSEGEEETESDTSSPKTGPEEANVPTFAVPPPPAPERASNLGTAPVAGLNLSSLVDRVVSAAEEQAAARQLRSEEELRALETAMKDARAAEERAAAAPRGRGFVGSLLVMAATAAAVGVVGAVAGSQALGRRRREAEQRR